LRKVRGGQPVALEQPPDLGQIGRVRRLDRKWLQRRFELRDLPGPDAAATADVMRSCVGPFAGECRDTVARRAVPGLFSRVLALA
jgi:hypothetical protein